MSENGNSSNRLSIIAIGVSLLSLAVAYWTFSQGVPYLAPLYEVVRTNVEKTDGRWYVVSKEEELAGVESKPMKLCKMSEGVPYNIRYTWKPRFVAGHQKTTNNVKLAGDTTIWLNEPEHKVTALSKDGEFIIEHLPIAYSHPVRKEIGYLYGILLVEYTDASGMYYSREFAFDINSPDDGDFVVMRLTASPVPVFEHDKAVNAKGKTKLEVYGY